jgi:hypothetical protein
MVTGCGIPHAEFIVTEMIRAALGPPETVQVVGWSRGTGAVVIELPRTSFVAALSEAAAWEAARRGRQPAT